MAVTVVQSAWTVKSINDRLVASCTVTAGTSDHDIYTLKTPKQLDPSKPWTLVVDIPEDVTAASATALDIWSGYAEDFALDGDDSTVAATHGALAVAITTDLDAGGIFSVRVVPGNNGAPAQVVTVPGAIVILPPVPYYAFNLDCTGAVGDAIVCTFLVIQ